ncbi:hypothetical protein OG352_06670 [Streptomyces sp. NBC_01485]|uniref:hypothetical protein n=1 Tax=Streptomyces sp. NBC_01485 TaxID=2903884 RepID=UPI002E3810A7|nr:hypothetical protein [Streptomyces sp. NBC_01485]
MTDEQSDPTPALALTNLQRDRVNFARCDLEAARTEDLGQLPPAGLIFLVERMRGRLGDILDLVDELADN